MILSKPHIRMQQAAMEKSVNVLSPVITIIKKADAFHCDGRQYSLSHFRQDLKSFFGVLGSGMLQDGLAVNLGELLSSYVESREYLVTSQQRQGANDYLTAVGAIRSTRSTGKPRTWGRDCREGADESALGFHITPRVA